jgi:hypothetical protein
MPDWHPGIEGTGQTPSLQAEGDESVTAAAKADNFFATFLLPHSGQAASLNPLLESRNSSNG